MISLWAGIAIVLGSKFIGGLLAFVQSLMQIIFVSNLWTPKVDASDQYTNTLLAIVQLAASFLMMTSIKPEVPMRGFKYD